MPIPAVTHPGTGQFVVNASFKISVTGKCDFRVSHAVDRFLQRLSRRTGIPLPNLQNDSAPNFVLTCDSGGEEIQGLEEDESYVLQLTSAGARLQAPDPLGVLHGLQTFLQLVVQGPNGFAVPAMTIKDHPRFPWRGLLIDTARHFMPVAVMKRNLDGMEALKFNVLHWHLSDDQGFRIESNRFPKLQQFGSDGMYYTQAEVRDVIQYARDRGIRVVPEFDVPGHSTSWFVGYPELASAPGPYQIERGWGVFDPAMDVTKDSTYKFLNDFIGEMAGLFPDRYFHIGGDEVNGKQWKNNPQIQDFMQQHGMKDHRDLQAYFNKRLQEMVSKHGKIMVGWDEILHPDLPQEIVVQSWRGQKSLAEAARRSSRGLLSSGYYLDLMFPAVRHYGVDPLSGSTASLAPEEKQRILGGEACMWAEFVTANNIDDRIWPRAAAVAERLWSAQDVKDVDSMYARLQKTSEYLDWLGLKHNANHRLMLQRLRGSSDIQALETLAGVLEPVKEYFREKTGNYDNTTALNRLVDTVHPESDIARQFRGLVDRYLARSSTPEEVQQMRIRLAQWRDNDQKLAPVLQESPLLKEIVPISRDLTTVGATGLQALDYLDHGGRAPTKWRHQQLAFLNDAEKPQAELFDMIVPAVKKLVQATSSQ
ncbi:MAG TPA: family 20 glycosylhydrolase [Candidatus Angelobacter sp.]